MKYNVECDGDIIEYLESKNISRRKIKSLVKYKAIKVNGKIIKLPHILNKGDIIEIKENNAPFDIVYEDKYILVVNKKEGLLTIGTEKEHENTLYHEVREYCNKKKEKVYIVNRLDKDTSGLVLFSKDEKYKLHLQDNWNEYVKVRKYYAIVVGKLMHGGTINKKLIEEKNTYVHVSNIGKEAITIYNPIKSNDEYTLLDIELKTGRKNQIRVHMQDLCYPILGDKKYGLGPSKRLYLHSYELEIIDKKYNRNYHFKIDIPDEFKKVVR